MTTLQEALHSLNKTSKINESADRWSELKQRQSSSQIISDVIADAEAEMKRYPGESIEYCIGQSMSSFGIDFNNHWHMFLPDHIKETDKEYLDAKRGYYDNEGIDEPVNEAVRKKVVKTIIEEHYHYVLVYDNGDHLIYYSGDTNNGDGFEDELNNNVKRYDDEEDAERDIYEANNLWCEITDMDYDELVDNYDGFGVKEIIDGERRVLTPQQDYIEEDINKSKRSNKLTEGHIRRDYKGYTLDIDSDELEINGIDEYDAEDFNEYEANVEIYGYSEKPYTIVRGLENARKWVEAHPFNKEREEAIARKESKIW